MDNYKISTKKDRQNSQNLNKDIFCTIPVSFARCIIGTEEKLDAAIRLGFDVDDYSQGFDLLEEVFRSLTE